MPRPRSAIPLGLRWEEGDNTDPGEWAWGKRSAGRSPPEGEERSHANRTLTARVHPHRASRRDCHYFHTGCDLVSRLRSGAGEGAAGDLPVEPEAALPG